MKRGLRLGVSKDKKQEANQRANIRRRKIIFFILIAAVIFSILGAVAIVSYIQASEPIPTRCSAMGGTCQNTCAGYNFADEDRKRSDCNAPLICCLT